MYSTPSMIALMERTSMLSLSPYLRDSETTVGGAVNIRHYKPTAMGKEVKCKSVVTTVKGKKVNFSVEVSENGELIGEGTHTRFVVEKEFFMKNV